MNQPAPPTLYEWRALVIVPETGLGLWTYVPGEDRDAAAENVETLTGGEVVTLERVDPRARKVAA